MHIFLILNQNEAREMIAFSLESKFRATVTGVETFKEAANQLRRGAEYDLIVCDYPKNSVPLFKHLSSQGLKIPIVLCMPDQRADIIPPSLKSEIAFSNQRVVAFVESKTLLDSLYRVVEGMAESQAETPGEGEMQQDSDFCRIRTGLLLRVSPLRADVFIRLSSEKYVKLFHEGADFDIEDQEKYLVKKNIEYLYLRKTECDEFIEKFKEELVGLLQSPLKPLAARRMSEEVHETIQQLIEQFGPSKEVQSLVKANVQLTLKSIGKSPRLKQLLMRLDHDKKKYIPSHSILLAHLSCALSVAMGWSSETTFNKLTLAALLHDITLTNHDLAASTDLLEVKRRMDLFKDEEILAFERHPLVASELARRFSQIPPDVDLIIAQHHENPDGTGFPRSLTFPNIMPLACLFIVAHDLVHFAFERDGKFLVDQFVESVKDKYTGGNFKRILKCLIEMDLSSQGNASEESDLA